MLLLITSSFAEEKEQKTAENLFGKVVFTSHRTSNGKLYAYLLENGKIENLGFRTDMAKISPNGKFVAGFVSEHELYIYDFKKKQVVKKYKTKYERYFSLEWAKDSKYLLYHTKEEIDKEKDIYNSYLMKLNIKNGKEEVLKKFENVGFWYNIKNINVSPNNKRIVLTIGVSGEYEDNNKIVKICVTDKNGQNEKVVWLVGTPLGWYPDNKNILIHTNRNKDGTMINDTEGRLYKLNVDTLEKEIVEETVPFPYTMEKLSKDGLYIYSVRYCSPLMAWNLVVGKVGERENESMLTYPVPFDFHGELRYSDDSAPDWWYK